MLVELLQLSYTIFFFKQKKITFGNGGNSLTQISFRTSAQSFFSSCSVVAVMFDILWKYFNKLTVFNIMRYRIRISRKSRLFPTSLLFLCWRAKKKVVRKNISAFEIQLGKAYYFDRIRQHSIYIPCCTYNLICQFYSQFCGGGGGGET